MRDLGLPYLWVEVSVSDGKEAVDAMVMFTDRPTQRAKAYNF